MQSSAGSRPSNPRLPAHFILVVAGVACIAAGSVLFGLPGSDGSGFGSMAGAAAAATLAGLAVAILQIRNMRKAHHAALAELDRHANDARDLGRLQRFTAYLSRAATPAEIIEAVVTEGLATLGARYSGVIRETGNGIRIDWDHGYPAGVHERMAEANKVADGPGMAALRSRQPAFYDTRAALESAFPHILDVWARLTPKRAACVPMMAGSAHMGTLVLHFVDREGFTSEDREFILTVARIAAQGLQRAALFEAARASEVRLTSAQQAAKIATWDWDLVTNRAEVSDGYRSMFGLPPGSGLPDYDSWLACVHPDDRVEAARAVTDVLASGTSYECDYRVLLSGGQVRHLNSRGMVHRANDGAAVRMVGAVTDITDRLTVAGSA